MRSKTPVKLPVIDFSKQDLIRPGTPGWDLVKVQVRQELEENGCFEASFDKVLEVQKALFDALQELFDLPLQTKQRYIFEKFFTGYFAPMGTPVESMFINEAINVENIEQRMTNILWPQGNTSFSKTMLSYSLIASGLEKTIRRMILESFGVEKYVDELIDSTNYIMRVIKYEGPQTRQPTLRAIPHRDQGMLSLLYQNEVNGLEIQTKDGEWISVKPSPNTFIVLIGESLSVWLNGRLSSPIHRVTMTGNKTRYCVALFASPRGGYQVKVPEELVDEEHPLLFKPFDYEGFLGFYSAQDITRRVTESGLKVYCSI
ncbi:hypothetical protein PTKIN_Ptkin13bG0129000 [Pterospermum kingtungense]